MKLHHPLLTVAFLAAGATTYGRSPPQTQEVCHTDAIPLQLTNWNDSLTIPKFDPQLGLLLSIRFELTGTAQGSAKFESLDASPATITTRFQTILTLSRPDASVLVIATPKTELVDSVTAFDGLIDFAGTSGKTYANLVVTETETVTSPPPASDLVLFTGPPGNPGTITLPVSAVGSSNASGAGNIITQFGAEAEASVRVCYTFAADCNGNGIADDVDISTGTSGDHDGDGIPDECQPSVSTFCVPEGPLGNGIDCPCSNNPAPGTLEGCDNGTGTGGMLIGTGVPSIASDSLVLTATQIPLSSPGFFFRGTAMENSGSGTPFDSGLRCLAGTVVAVQKFPMLSGGGTLPLPGSPPISSLISASAGDVTYFQYWYRNPHGPCGGSANTTNGLKIVWGL